jgi:pimeloyl-ACP methyl ester carboxylesterase
MGVVGTEIRPLLTFQIFGAKLARLHEESDVDGDGYLTAREAAEGLIGMSAEDAAGYREVLLSGDAVNPTTDRDHDGRLAIDTEVGPVFRELTGIDNYPNVNGIDPPLVNYLLDIARFGSVSVDLPRFDGPSLLLNGETDIQTPARAALIADAALAAAGREHKLVLYPGMGHLMTVTPKFTPTFGEPDPVVLRDIQQWLAAHK